MKKLSLRFVKKGQATTELAIMGTVVIMVLAYLIQQGYIYNCRQALEMYAFRKTLELSQSEERGINLTVIRDVISPSFFSGLNRQRLMASSSIEYNPYKIYTPYAEDPEDVPSRQFIQLNEAMIRNGDFFEIPPTKVRVERRDDQGQVAQDTEWMWVASSVNEIDPQNLPVRVTRRTSNYNYGTTITEDRQNRVISKDLESEDIIPTVITFEDEQRTVDNYFTEDWEGRISSVGLDTSTIPKNINLILEETIRREKSVQTPQ